LVCIIDICVKVKTVLASSNAIEKMDDDEDVSLSKHSKSRESTPKKASGIAKAKRQLNESQKSPAQKKAKTKQSDADVEESEEEPKDSIIPLNVNDEIHRSSITTSSNQLQMLAAAAVMLTVDYESGDDVRAKVGVLTTGFMKAIRDRNKETKAEKRILQGDGEMNAQLFAPPCDIMEINNRSVNHMFDGFESIACEEVEAFKKEFATKDNILQPERVLAFGGKMLAFQLNEEV